MKRIVAVGILTAIAACARPPARTIKKASLEDKIRGGWAGQMIGVAYGAPTEFKSNGKIIETPLSWSPERVSNALTQDDLYVDMTFAEVIDRFGLDATAEQYGEAFKNSKYMLWHANASGRRNLTRGIPPTMSGHPKYNLHANDIDFQIESDFIGLMTPGLPAEANRLAERIGRLMSYGDGLYGGMFVAGVYSAAFFTPDPREAVAAGLKSIPAGSSYAALIRDLLAWSAKNPDDWKKTWQLLREKWDKDDPCPKGALDPYNIDAKLNGAYIALGLIYGKRDFGKTVEIATRAGQDSDCNPSTAGGILGVMLGYSGIPDEWKSGIPKIAGSKFDYTQYSFDDVSKATLANALKAVERAGGKVTAAEVIIPEQAVKAPELEQWTPGIPEKRIAITDDAWRWGSGWRKDQNAVVSDTPGAEAELRFTGASVALAGPLSTSGGRADVYLDGKKLETLDAWAPPRTSNIDLWHAYNLAPGPHTLRLVIRVDADERSTGRSVAILRAITYR